jgi:hypothetical protein
VRRKVVVKVQMLCKFFFFFLGVIYPFRYGIEACIEL